MPKEIPDCPKQPAPLPEASQGLEIELITPMVGGGVTPGETDVEQPARATAIRGHLRHWWRLTIGRALGTGMWQREKEVFGSTEFPSPVAIRVSGWSKVMQFNPSNDVDQLSPIAYALFASIENGHRVANEGIKFNLMIHAPAQESLNRRRKTENEQRQQAERDLLPPTIDPIQPDLDTALQAWLAFGGLGGRTRRGCGAVHSKILVGGLPKCPGRVFVGKPQSSAVAAWREALQAYRDFRQTPRGRMHPKVLMNGRTVQVPGRIHWPEADSIRKITGCSLKPAANSAPGGVPTDEDTHDHSTPVVPVELLPAFPKAALGLPINFHFVDGPGRNRPAASNLDPQDVQLYPLVLGSSGKLEKAERMASPVITRPIWLEGKWHPGVVILHEALPDPFKVRVEGKNAAIGGNLSLDIPASQVVDPKLGAISPMRGQANAIAALIEYLTKQQKWRAL